MQPSLLRPQGHFKPADALELAQRAPEILRRNPKAFSASPLLNLFSAPETAQLWTIYENLMLSCLRVGDDTAARDCLERLVRRFGDQDERIMALRGLVKEATASNEVELKAVLDDYEALLQQNGANIPIHKRKVALLRSMGKTADSIAALNALLDFNATDPEAWAELADMYLFQGLYQQASYALEEVLVLMPNAWNIHARLGEVSLMAADASSEGNTKTLLAESLRRFCRSIELCDDYLRGYYGLKMVTDRILSGDSKAQKQQEEIEGLAVTERTMVEKLNQAATQKLAEIVRHHEAREKLWQGYDAGEIEAARELLAKLSRDVVR